MPSSRPEKPPVRYRATIQRANARFSDSVATITIELDGLDLRRDADALDIVREMAEHAITDLYSVVRVVEMGQEEHGRGMPRTGRHRDCREGN